MVRVQIPPPERLDLDLISLFQLQTTFVGDDYVEHTEFGDRPIQQKWARVEELGRGRFGIVWLQRRIHDQTGNADLRAVKVLRKDRDGIYRSEIAALAKFSKYHHVFVGLQGWYEEGNYIYLAQDYFELGDLGHHMKSMFPEHRVKSIASQLLEGIAILHRERFAHRDLSPQNVLVASTSPHWRVKIADFGCAKRVQTINDEMMTMVGTPAYQAPEMYNFFESIDYVSGYTGAVDMWSLGCILYELLAGAKPFGWDLRYLKSYCNGAIPFPVEPLRALQVSEAGIGVVQSLLQVLPEKRATAEQALNSPWLRSNFTESSEPDAARINHLVESDSREQAVVRFFTDGQYETSSRAHMTRALLAATKSGHLDAAYVAVENGADIEGQLDDGKRALHLAAKYGNVMIATFLLAKYANLEAEDRDGRRPLHYAARSGHAEIVKILLSEGSKSTALDRENNTALHFAAESNADNCAELILKCRDHLFDAKNSLGDTPFQLAVRASNSATALRLLKLAGDGRVVDIRSLDKDSLYPIEVAVSNRMYDLTKQLLEWEVHPDSGRDSNYRSQWTRTESSKTTKQLEDMRDEHRKGTKTTQRGHPTPLARAVRQGDLMTAKLLVDRGANMLTQNGDGQTLLHSAAEGGAFAAVSWLIDSGFDPNQFDLCERLPLGYAAEKGHARVVRLLISKYKQPKTTREFIVDHPLNRAIKNRHFEVAKMLIRSKLFRRVVDEQNRTPMICAIEASDLRTVEMLLKAGLSADGDNKLTLAPLSYAAKCSDVRMMELLMAAKADINTNKPSKSCYCGCAGPTTGSSSSTSVYYDVEGRTPLHYAAIWGGEEALRLLLDNAVRTETQDGCGRTALSYVAEIGSVKQAELLLKRGASVHGCNRRWKFYYNTPLILAVQRVEHGMVQLLLDHGADVHIKDGNGMSAAQWITAMLAQHPDQLDLQEVRGTLLKAGAFEPPPMSYHLNRLWECKWLTFWWNLMFFGYFMTVRDFYYFWMPDDTVWRPVKLWPGFNATVIIFFGFIWVVWLLAERHFWFWEYKPRMPRSSEYAYKVKEIQKRKFEAGRWINFGTHPVVNQATF